MGQFESVSPFAANAEEDIRVILRGNGLSVVAGTLSQVEWKQYCYAQTKTILYLVTTSYLHLAKCREEE